MISAVRQTHKSPQRRCPSAPVRAPRHERSLLIALPTAVLRWLADSDSHEPELRQAASAVLDRRDVAGGEE